MQSLKPLFDSAREGNRESFDRLVEGLRERLTAFVRSRMGSDLQMYIDVDDVVQETSLKAMQSLPQIEWQGDGALVSWFCGIAINIIYNNSRRYAGSVRFKMIWCKMQTIRLPANMFVAMSDLIDLMRVWPH